MEIAKCIYNIFYSQLSIVGCWGAHNFVATNNGLRFNVQGFVFTGIVEVLYEEQTGTFGVRLENADGTPLLEYSNIRLHCLVDIIDKAVEKNCSDEEYKQKVREAQKIVRAQLF